MQPNKDLTATTLGDNTYQRRAKALCLSPQLINELFTSLCVPGAKLIRADGAEVRVSLRDGDEKGAVGKPLDATQLEFKSAGYDLRSDAIYFVYESALFPPSRIGFQLPLLSAWVEIKLPTAPIV